MCASLVAVLHVSVCAASTCSRTLRDACERCQAASGPNCKQQYSWSWTASLKENDKHTYLTGVEAVRGIDALNAPRVETVDRWNQSNWPGIAKELAPGIVRAASEEDKKLLCSLWQKEHSYQAWTVLLGCPGREAEEYERPCNNIGAVVRIPCASIDLTGDSTIMGGIFDSTRWFRVGQYMHPPQVCDARRAVQMDEVGIAMSVYPTAMGHFVPEQLPKVLLLHSTLPAEVPIIVGDGPVVRRFLEPLVAMGVAKPDRFLYMPFKYDGTIVQAKSVYTVLNSHFSNAASGDEMYRITRATYSPNGSVPVAQRTTIVLVDRGVGAARSLTNNAEVRAVLEAAAARYAPGSNKEGNAGHHFHVVNWRPHPTDLRLDIETFRHAAMIVAPHGAGLSNLIFASEGTPVIEICYKDNSGMTCPSMYGAMAANLHMPYWVILGEGGYGSPMRADLVQLSKAAKGALATIVALHRGHGKGAGGAGRGRLSSVAESGAAEADGDGEQAASLIRRMRNACGRPRRAPRAHGNA